MDTIHGRESHLLPSGLAAIGSTPLVELARLTKGLEGRIRAKLEYLNPGFSKKDRIALQMIQDAEEQGLLQPDDTVVELTSGNTGTGLAIVCGIQGYHFVAVMSRGNSIERARMMSALVRFVWATVRGGTKLPFALIMAFLYTRTKRGMADRVTDQVERLLGRPPISMRQYIEDYAAMWQ
jgi:hypothetical protein